MSDWTEIRDTVEKYIPYAAGAVNPALGAVLATALGTKPDPASVQAALVGDPEAQVKLMGLEVQIKQIVANQAVADHQAELALQQSDVTDRGSARILAAAKGFMPQLTLTAIFTIGYFSLMYYLVSHVLEIPPVQMALLSSFLGVMTGQVVQQGNFWFGSSHGSQKKDDAIASIAQMP